MYMSGIATRNFLRSVHDEFTLNLHHYSYLPLGCMIKHPKDIRFNLILPTSFIECIKEVIFGLPTSPLIKDFGMVHRENIHTKPSRYRMKHKRCPQTAERLHRGVWGGGGGEECCAADAVDF